MSGDYKLEDSVYILFTTRAFATGIPGVLSAATVAVYEDVTATPIETSIAVTETLNSINGLNAVTIAALAASGYNAGGHYHVVIEAGTVDSVSVVGEVVGNFSIQASPVNWAKVTAPTTAVDLSATDIQLVATTTTNADMVTEPPTAVQNRQEMDSNSVDFNTIITALGTAGDGLTAQPWNADWDTEVQSEVNDALVALGLDHLVGAAVVGADVVDNSIIAKLVSASATADWDDFVNTTESLQAIRDRGDAAWITGGGGGITDILNIQALIPLSIDLADTATFRLGLMLINSLDDLPSTAEIDPGTISIDRKAIGGTSWSAIVTDAACLESAGLIYYDEVFDSGTGYAEGDTIRITLKSQKITVAANDYEISDATGRLFYTSIRQTMRGTDSANTVVPDAAGTAPTAIENRQEMDSNSTKLIAILADTLPIGYLGPEGYGIYVDGAAANTNTVDGVDGIFSNPVSTFIAARTLADSLGIEIYYVLNNSDLTLAATHVDWEFVGFGAMTDNIINLGSQDVSRSRFLNMVLEGTQGGAGRIEAERCALQDPGAGVSTFHIFALGCGIVDDITLDTSNDNVFVKPFSLVAGDSAPIIRASGAAGTLQLRGMDGGVDFRDLSASHNMSISQVGQVIFDASCNVNANVTLYGIGTITDNTAGMASLTQGAYLNMSKINTECDTAISDAALASAAALATVDTVVDAIKVITDQFVFTVANQVDSNALSVSGTAQTAGDLAALIATMDAVADAIRVVTDKFAFTVANQVDSNVKSINDVTITGDGSATPFDV